jgi:hypothetical protein
VGANVAKVKTLGGSQMIIMTMGAMRLSVQQKNRRGEPVQLSELVRKNSATIWVNVAEG